MNDGLAPGGKIPFREPADHEVAAGAIGGLTASIAVWVPATLASPAEHGPLFPLRLVAASVLGAGALDSGAAAPAVVGAALAALVAVVFGLVFVSILPPAATSRKALLAGGAYGAALFAPTWFALVRVVDPILYSAGYALPAFLLHVGYGALLGIQVPLLRKVFP